MELIYHKIHTVMFVAVQNKFICINKNFNSKYLLMKYTEEIKLVYFF